MRVGRDIHDLPGGWRKAFLENLGSKEVKILIVEPLRGVKPLLAMVRSSSLYFDTRGRFGYLAQCCFSPFPGSYEMESNAARWIINVVAFILFALMVITGAAAWLLPHGGGPASAVYGLRQALRAVHQVGALLFSLTIVIHLLLHARYIRQNLKKSALIKDR